MHDGFGHGCEGRGARFWGGGRMWGRHAWGGRHGGMHGRGRRPGGGGRFFDHGALRFVVLSLLADKPRNGYELIKAIEEKSGGSYSPSPGVIYPTLNLLEEAGHIRPVEIDGKKAFEISEDGKAALEANRKIVETFEERMQGDAEGAQRAELRQALGRLTLAIRSKMAEGGLPEAQLKTLIAAINAAAEEVEKA